MVKSHLKNQFPTDYWNQTTLSEWSTYLVDYLVTAVRIYSTVGEAKMSQKISLMWM